MAWSTNGTFIWPADDKDVIGDKGHHIAIELNADNAQFCGKSPAELCAWIVERLRAAEAGSGAHGPQA